MRKIKRLKREKGNYKVERQAERRKDRQVEKQISMKQNDWEGLKRRMQTRPEKQHKTKETSYLETKGQKQKLETEWERKMERNGDNEWKWWNDCSLLENNELKWNKTEGISLLSVAQSAEMHTNTHTDGQTKKMLKKKMSSFYSKEMV